MYATGKAIEEILEEGMIAERLRTLEAMLQDNRFSCEEVRRRAAEHRNRRQEDTIQEMSGIVEALRERVQRVRWHERREERRNESVTLGRPLLYWLCQRARSCKTDSRTCGVSNAYKVQ